MRHGNSADLFQEQNPAILVKSKTALRRDSQAKKAPP